MTRNRAEAAALAAYNELSGPRAGSQAPSRRNFQNSVQVAEPGRVRVGVPSARTRWRNEPPARLRPRQIPSLKSRMPPGSAT